MKNKIITFILLLFVISNFLYSQDDTLDFHPQIIGKNKPEQIVSDIVLDYKPGQTFFKWNVKIKSDLTAYYENVMKYGENIPYDSNLKDTTLRYQGTIDKYFYKRLNDLIQTISFFSMEDEYGEQHSHSGILTLSVTLNGKTKSIWIKNDEPVELWALKNLIFYLKDKIIKWEQIN